jgi:NAD(P)-dependent dehydrogenase (short-subunit alcohol dehydrogenase family)
MAATLAAGRDFIISKVPLARIGEPEDVAMTCVFLASKAGGESSFPFLIIVNCFVVTEMYDDG